MLLFGECWEFSSWFGDRRVAAVAVGRRKAQDGGGGLAERGRLPIFPFSIIIIIIIFFVAAAV